MNLALSVQAKRAGMKRMLALYMPTVPAWARIDFAPIPAGEFVMGNSRFDVTVFELPDGKMTIASDSVRAA